MVGGITIGVTSQIQIIKNFLKGKLIDLHDLPPIKLRENTKIFLNGEWLGMVPKPFDLVKEFKERKMKGSFDMTVSIVHNIRESEIKIYSDGGRLFRPVIRVIDNKLQLTLNDINQISLNKSAQGKITSWNQFMIEKPGRIEYIDVEESDYLLVAKSQLDVIDMRERMVNSVQTMKKSKLKSNSSIVNRYDDMQYVKYTHCEIHPSFLIGIVATNIPFCNHNAGARNIFQYAQGRQAMGIYVSNYRNRLDISYILYNPQKPLVTTRTAKYTYVDILACGENCVVAVLCYTGYNQEDSLIFNQSALDRGLFRSMSLKKYSTAIQKNQTTSQDDIFTKPDPTKVTGMRRGSYDKLNDKGYIPKETRVEDGDIIIGKVSPIQPIGNSNKIFKDNSETYRGHESGVIDEVYTGVYNNEGYEMYKMRIRSERIPVIGDKFCFSKDHDILTTDGWISIDKVTLNHKVATLVDGKKLEYHKPTAIQNLTHKGKMYKLKSNQVDLCVTPNHRMYVASKEPGAKFKILLAEDIYGLMKKYKKNVETYEPVTKMDKFILPKCDGIEEDLICDMDAWITFFGIWIAEGCTLRDWGVCFAAHKQRVKNALEECCSKLGFEIHKHKDSVNDEIAHVWCTPEKRVTAYIHPLSVGATEKSLPDWCWNLNTKQAQLLIKSMCLGDGHFMKGTTNTYRYDTSSVKLSNDFQRLCLHAGWSTNIVLKYKAGHKSIVRTRNGIVLARPEVITSTKDAWRMTVITVQNEPLVNKNKAKGKQHDEWIDFDDQVYCCTVPGDGVIYVKRNGVPVWAGNCSKHGQKGTVGLTLAHSEMPFTKNGITPDIILNPNAIPSRMTIGQLVECLVGKVAILNGKEADGTPFNILDLESTKNELERLGYERNGTEYLYNGMTGQKLKSMIFIGPTYYQRLKHLVNDKMHCLTMDHEVLTSKGWKFYNDITLNDDIATLSNGNLEYAKPTNLLYYPEYDGELYHIESQMIDLTVTMEHRMWVSKRFGRKAEWLDHDFVMAKDLVGQHVKYKKDAIWDVPDYQFVLPEVRCNNGVIYEAKTVDMDVWLVFFGIWIAEGWTNSSVDKRWPDSRSYITTICQCKERVRAVIYDSFEKLGFHCITDKDKLNIAHKQLYTYMDPLSVGAPQKSLPDWVWKLSSRQCQKLIENMILGDGSYCDSGSTRYYTSSILLADQFQRLCLHAGWSATKTLYHKVGKMAPMRDGRQIIAKHDLWKLGVNKTKNTPAVNHGHTKEQNVQVETVQKSKCPVFCLEVPSEVFYVRRNGKTVWTGNSRARGPKTLLVRQPPEGRSRDGGLRFGEMERDSLLGHGMAKFLKERLMDTSDAYTCYVCGECGLFAQRMIRKDNKSYSSTSDIYYCPACNNKTNIAKVMIPYAFKLLMQELMCMCIAPRIRVKESIYTN
jgi:hypothetical protein